MVRTFFAWVMLAFLMAGCSQGNVTEDDSFKQYFDAAGVNGCFGMFDNGQGHFTIYNLHRYRDSSYLPAGTFDVMQALIGVQTGVVKDERDTLGGDTLTLGEAFRHSSTPAFRELARRIGKDTLKKWIDSLGYGNKDIATDEFWMDNHLTITPDEQLGLIKKLYFDQLPFFPHSQKLVRQMMEMEGNSNYQLIYKKATGVAKNGHAFSWYIGWIEENKHPYFFVLNLDAAAGVNTEQAGLGILKNILKQLGFFLGKK